jgi:sec-independent protein translocase protein TatA
MFGLGWQELAIVLVIVLIVFGAGKLPTVAKQFGQGVREFKSEAGTPIGSGDAASDADGRSPSTV